MNRQQRTLIVLVVALFAASVAAYGVYGAITRIQVREVGAASKYAVVAAKAMPSGALVTKDAVKVVPWPRSQEGLDARSIDSTFWAALRSLADTGSQDRSESSA